jgi:uncharacterized integral membrane protein
VTTDPTSSQPQEPQSAAPTPPPAPPDKVLPVTRASAAWVATAIALLLLAMLIVFILQNSTRVEVHYLGLAGSLPLGMALLIAAVGAGVVVAIAGGARVTQLRRKVRRTRRTPARVPDASTASVDQSAGDGPPTNGQQGGSA